MNYLHGSQNIDSWIKAAFVQEDQAFGFDITVHLLHVWRDVARGGHVLAESKASLADRGMHPRWDK